MTHKIFVDEQIRVFEGAEAEQRLLLQNDSRYLTKNGIVAVDRERWLKAQQYEESTWMERGLAGEDDRNHEHKERFDGYNALNKIPIESVIELGCGPFTNLRVMLSELSTLKEATLLDPLLAKYLYHPHCSYKGGFPGIKLNLISSSIEEFEPTTCYDMAVMINVLEHCFDVPKIFEKILGLLKPNGVMVFHDVYTRADDMEEMANNHFDAGHPIRIEEIFLKTFLYERFNTLFLREFHGLYGQPRRNDIYFIGKKK